MAWKLNRKNYMNNPSHENLQSETDNAVNAENEAQPQSEDQQPTTENQGPDWQAQFEEMRSKYQYLLAEFENARRRNSRERTDLLKTAGKDVLVSLLPVLDDFERGLEQIENAANIQALKEGVQLIYSKLHATLLSQGLEPVSAKGQPFDAEIHEAIGKLAAPGQEGLVVAEVEKGYRLNDQVIRFAKVLVGE